MGVESMCNWAGKWQDNSALNIEKFFPSLKKSSIIFIYSSKSNFTMKQIFTALLLLAAMGLAANNLQITRVALVDNDPVAKTVMIEFDLSWDNSWRDDINWDAAWVIAKFFTGELPYPHCKLALEGAAAGGGIGHTLIVPDESLTLNDTPYGVGAFIYRDAAGSGTFAATGARLKWNYGLNGFTQLPEDIEVSLYATEMVYIPEGPFAFGDGDGTNANGWRVKGTNDYVYIDDYLAPLMINNIGDEQATIHGIRVHGKEGLDWDGDGVIDNPRFPTGYKAFYIMKYETTQGQYADFLNTLTPNQISYANLFTNTIQARFTITYQDGKYACSRPDRVCNFFSGGGLSWNEQYRTASIADWIGLRPMTAMEFEKAARGPVSPVVGEYAWGNVSAVAMLGISDEENGTELPLPANSNIYEMSNISGGDGGSGPLRSGIFARESSDRIGSGASYYGVMELSGNMHEMAIEMFFFFYTYYGGYRSYIDEHGDGDLDDWGLSNSIKVTFGNLHSFARSARSNGVSSWPSDGYPVEIGARFVRNAPELP